MYTLETLLKRQVQIKPDFDTFNTSNVHYLIRSDVQELQRDQVIGIIAQASDRYVREFHPDLWDVFVTFEGRNGHWFQLCNLDFVNQDVLA